MVYGHYCRQWQLNRHPPVFGSAVVAIVDKQSGQAALGFTFEALLGFHKLYSRALLSAARSRLAMSAKCHKQTLRSL